MITNVPPIQFTSTGLILPTQEAILAGVMADINAAFGGNLNLSLSTPQGQLASSMAAIISDKNNQIAYISNMADPTNATGRWQDAIGEIYFLTRYPAKSTIVQANCYGLTGTTIPVGALAQDINGNIYSCTIGGVIPAGGFVSATFASNTQGAVAVTSGSLNSIYQAVTGWESITNPADGVIGQAVESRIAFENRRQASVAGNAVGILPSVYAAVTAVTGVLDCYVFQNPTSATITAGVTNFPLVANSLYVAAVGGNPVDIAQAIWAKASLGCNFNGNTTIVVNDTSYAFPYPSYSIKFNIPTSVPIKFDVKILNNPNLPSNIGALIKAAIVNSFTGNDGGLRSRIGSVISSGRFFAGIAAVDINVSVSSVLLGTSTATLASVTMGIDQVPTISEANILVTLI
jgi:uncharacterized phage protein gp47/JayE